MTTYVITGGTGCLGFALTRILLSKKPNAKIIALGRNPKLGKKLEKMGATFYPIALSDRQGLKDIAANASVIFHCAAMSSAWGNYEDFYQTNVVGTENVIAATPVNARLIHVSTPSLYFNYTPQYNIEETAPLPNLQVNHYITTKHMAEESVLNAYQKHGLNTIIIRPRGIFGPNDRAILPRIMKLYHNGVMPIIGDGKQLVDITYVDNVAESMLLAAHADDKLNGRIYNITNGEPLPFIEILQMVFNALEKPVRFQHKAYWWIKPLASLLEKFFQLPFIDQEPPLTSYTAAVMSMGQTLSIKRAQDELHYQPHISIKEGIDRFAHWSKHQC